MLAYLDANTGSIVLAALAGGAAGLAVLVKMYWNRILGLFSKKHREKADEARAELLDHEDDDADTDGGEPKQPTSEPSSSPSSS